MNCVSACSDVIQDIQNKLQDIRNPIAAMMVLLRELDLETDSEVPGEPAALGTRFPVHLELPVWTPLV